MEHHAAENMRFDLQVISSRIESGSKVLDLGCGYGELLTWLTENKAVSGVGIEQDKDKAAHCIAQGLSVLQGDMMEDLDDYPDKCFDYVILSQSLQQIYEPARLLHTLSRIGRRFIVSFPNFSHYTIRFELFFRGIAPKSPELPYHWYDSPNIRVITLKDFRRFARDVGYRIIEEIAINTNDHSTAGSIVRFLSNIRATYGIFIIEKNPTGTV
ncbi:MAG: methionine biosynthesis protein MetW [Proteobacteria bacterium]|nr:MAG: methionine biosynthesis protein MetW [Pseudomonadota bacterium]